jgi:hypothetical protein
MKSSITIPCSCGSQIPLDIRGSVLPDSAKCGACGATIYLMAPLGNVVTMLLMERAKWELKNKDITMAILLSAMAVEAQISWVFFKWREIDDGLLPHEQTQAHRERWEGEWTDMRNG